MARSATSSRRVRAFTVAILVALGASGAGCSGPKTPVEVGVKDIPTDVKIDTTTTTLPAVTPPATPVVSQP